MVLILLSLVAGVLFWIAYPILFSPPMDPADTPWPGELTLIERAEWGEEEISHPEKIDPMVSVSRITIHHDGMPPLPMKTESQIKSRIVSIRKSHSKKYADIGYHFIIDPLGRVWEGRPIDFQGAHVQGQNENNVGILFLGNTYEDKPTEAALDGMFRFIRYLRLRFEIDEDQIKTHRELAQTGCPGKFLQEEIVKARKAGKLKVAPPPIFAFDSDEYIKRLQKFAEKVIEAFEELMPEKSGVKSAP